MHTPCYDADQRGFLSFEFWISKRQKQPCPLLIQQRTARIPTMFSLVGMVEHFLYVNICTRQREKLKTTPLPCACLSLVDEMCGLIYPGTAVEHYHRCSTIAFFSRFSSCFSKACVQVQVQAGCEMCPAPLAARDTGTCSRSSSRRPFHKSCKYRRNDSFAANSRLTLSTESHIFCCDTSPVLCVHTTSLHLHCPSGMLLYWCNHH